MKKSDILKRFSKLLVKPSYPKRKMAWNIKGRLKNSNREDRFDVQDFKILEDGDTDNTEPIFQFCVLQNKISFAERSQFKGKFSSLENSSNTNPCVSKYFS